MKLFMNGVLQVPSDIQGFLSSLELHRDTGTVSAELVKKTIDFLVENNYQDTLYLLADYIEKHPEIQLDDYFIDQIVMYEKQIILSTTYRDAETFIHTHDHNASVQYLTEHLNKAIEQHDLVQIEAIRKAALSNNAFDVVYHNARVAMDSVHMQHVHAVLTSDAWHHFYMFLNGSYHIMLTALTKTMM